MTLPSRLKTGTALAAMTIFLGLSACGGGGGSSAGGGNIVTPPPPAPTGSTFGLNGAAVKGLIKNGVVSVQDAADATNVLVTGTTSATDGSFSVTIPASANFDGPFVKVIVTGGAGATSVCDAAAGCGAVSFGDDFAIDSSVSLSAIIPTPANNGSRLVNVTPLTHFASEIAAAAPLTTESLSQAQSKVSNLFGLMATDLTELPAINVANGAADITNADAFRAALISGGILSGIQDSGSDLGAGLTALAAEIRANDGQLFFGSGQSGSGVGFDSILEGASEVADASPISTASKSLIEAQLTADALSAASADDTRLTGSTESPTAGAAALVQAKAFVSDLQLIHTAIDDAVDGPDFEAFSDRVNTASELISVDAETAFQAIFNGLEVMNAAFNAYSDDNTLTTFSDQGLTVSIASGADGVDLAIANGTLDSFALNLTATVANSLVSDETGSSGQGVDTQVFFSLDEATGSGDASVKFSGSAEDSNVAVTFNDGVISLANVNLVVLDEFYANNYDRTESVSRDVNIGEFDLSADIDIIQKITDGLSFNGIFSTRLLNANFNDAQIDTGTYFGRVLEADVTSGAFGLEATDIGLSGKLSEGGQSVDLTFSLGISGDKLSLAESPETFTYAEYTVTDNVLTLDVTGGSGTKIEHSFVSAEEAAMRLEAIAAQLETTSFVTPTGVTLVRTGDTNHAVLLIDDTTAPVLEYKVVRATGSTQSDITLWFQAANVGSIFPGDGVSGYVPDAQPKITDYVNGIFASLNGNASIGCEGDGRLVLYRQTPYAEQGGVWTGYELNQSAGEAACLTLTGNQSRNYFSVPTTQTTDPDAAANAIFAASLRQDIAGVDADDKEVEFKAFGPAALAGGDVTGSLTFELSFAGRRFRTNARDFNIVDDLTQPIEISNQDGFTLTASQAADGTLSGTLSKDGTAYATLTDGNGIPLFTFTDDSFVSVR